MNQSFKLPSVPERTFPTTSQIAPVQIAARVVVAVLQAVSSPIRDSRFLPLSAAKIRKQSLSKAVPTWTLLRPQKALHVSLSTD